MGDTLSVGANGAILDRAKGYLVTGDGTHSVSLPVGTDGTILTADSSAATGISWQPIADGVIQAGEGLSFNGSTLNVGGSATIGVDADTVFVNSDATAGRPLLSAGTVGTAAAYGALDISTAGNVTGALSIVNGGTGTDGTSFVADSILATNASGDSFVTTGLSVSDLPSKFEISTTSDTPTTLGTYTAQGRAITVEANILATSETAAANFRIRVLILNGAVINTDLVYAPYASTWAAAITATQSGNGAEITITVTGAAATAIGWKALVETLTVDSPP